MHAAYGSGVVGYELWFNFIVPCWIGQDGHRIDSTKRQTYRCDIIDQPQVSRSQRLTLIAQVSGRSQRRR